MRRHPADADDVFRGRPDCHGGPLSLSGADLSLQAAPYPPCPRLLSRARMRQTACGGHSLAALALQLLPVSLARRGTRWIVVMGTPANGVLLPAGGKAFHRPSCRCCDDGVVLPGLLPDFFTVFSNVLLVAHIQVRLGAVHERRARSRHDLGPDVVLLDQPIQRDARHPQQRGGARNLVARLR
jgi:hypothetical protein